MQLIATNKNIILLRLIIAISLYLFYLPASIAQGKKDSLKNTTKIIIENANSVENINDLENFIFTGNVVFKNDSTIVSCDTAYILDNYSRAEAYGNVIVNQNDSIFLYGDTLYYDSKNKFSEVRGKVRLTEKDLTLSTNYVYFDMVSNVASFNTKSIITSKKNENTLTSNKGFYYSDNQKITFLDSVELKNPEYVMNSDTLDYFESTEVAYFGGKTTIVGKNNFIYCENGWYDTKNDISEFNENAYLISDKQKLQGQKLYYDRVNGIGKAFDNVIITDTSNKFEAYGNTAFHFEKLKYSFITDSALLLKEFESDTLGIHADSIKIQIDTTTESKSFYAYYGVRFFKSDIQGVSDSLSYSQADSTLKLFKNPILWNEQNQISGDTILIFIQNKSLQKINTLKNSFIISQVDSSDKFNQIKGNDMTAFFTNDSIRKIQVNGNGQSIYYIAEEGKTATEVNSIIASDIEVYINRNQIESILFIKEPEGTFWPIQQLSIKDSFLDNFKWEIKQRPLSISSLIE